MTTLEQLANGEVSVMESYDDTEPVTENTIAAVLAMALEETCNEEELDELVEQANSNLLVLTPVEERSIVKLDKKAKKQQAYKVALYKAADEKNLKEFKQLKTLWAAERELDAIIERKCHARAKQIMNEMMRKSKESSTPKIKKAGDSITRSQARTKKALSGMVKADHKTQAQAKKIGNKFGLKH